MRVDNLNNRHGTDKKHEGLTSASQMPYQLDNTARDTTGIDRPHDTEHEQCYGSLVDTQTMLEGYACVAHQEGQDEKSVHHTKKML